MKQYKNKDYYVVNIEQDGNVIIKIDNFENPINYYMNLLEPENYKSCEECGGLIKVHNARKYCNFCANKIKIKQTVEARNLKSVEK